MVDLVHLTPERNARRIGRSGIAARSRGWEGARGVYLMPVLPSFTLTHQWSRELRRWQSGRMMAVDVRLPDETMLFVGHYGRQPQPVTAAEAVGIVRALDDPRGYQVFLARAVAPAEVRRVRHIPPGVGWRYMPGAHGRRPCGCPVCLARGTPGSAKIRRRYELD